MPGLDAKIWADAARRILDQAKSGDIRVTATKLVDALLGKGQANLKLSGWKTPELYQSSVSCSARYLVETIVSNMLLEGYLKEDFHFTPYSTISYILPTKANIPPTYRIAIPITLTKERGLPTKRSTKDPNGQKLMLNAKKPKLKCDISREHVPS